MKKFFKLFLIIISVFMIFNFEVTYARYEENAGAVGGYNGNSIETEKLSGCSSLLGDPKANGEGGTPASPAYYLSFAFSVMRYAAIVLLIVMTIMDFVGALAAQDNDVMRKSISKLGKRAIMCVIIFLLPTLIDFALQFLHQSQISDCIDLSK